MAVTGITIDYAPWQVVRIIGSGSFGTVYEIEKKDEVGVTRAALKDMFPKVQLMRHRFNLLDLGKRAGFYDRLVEGIFRPGGAWDLQQEKS